MTLYAHVYMLGWARGRSTTCVRYNTATRSAAPVGTPYAQHKVLCRKVRPLHNCCTMSERPTKHDNYKTPSYTLVINDYKITLTRVRLDFTKHNRHNSVCLAWCISQASEVLCNGYVVRG